MLATLVIGLREGLEASLIVGIIASFLARNGRRDALRATWLGVAAATALCVAIGVALVQLSKDLPQQAQEGLETVIGAAAVIMVTFMIVWMARHARSMKKELEGAAASALARGSARALVAMAFLAVLREGFETSVFLVSVINSSTNRTSGTIGVVLGLAIAIVIGYGIYRGGVKLNLARFFKLTGLVLVLVAAGLTMTVFHTAHEAGWVNFGQTRLLDLTWLVTPGSVQASLLTGVLGLQAHPTLVEVTAWVLYAVPMIAFVAWPRGKRPTPVAVPASATVDAGAAGRDPNSPSSTNRTATDRVAAA
jgi:high-affinity iron transporter